MRSVICFFFWLKLLPPLFINVSSTDWKRLPKCHLPSCRIPLHPRRISGPPVRGNVRARCVPMTLRWNVALHAGAHLASSPKEVSCWKSRNWPSAHPCPSRVRVHCREEERRGWSDSSLLNFPYRKPACVSQGPPECSGKLSTPFIHSFIHSFNWYSLR